MTNSDDIDDPRQEAESALTSARAALEAGNRQLAADYVSRALFFAPTLPAVHELLATLADPELFALYEGSYISSGAARAHLLAATGDPTEALKVLVSVQRYDPERPWSTVPWLVDPALPAQIEPNNLIDGIVELLGIMQDRVEESVKPGLEPYVELLNNAVAIYPDNPVLLTNASIFVRRMGCLERATELAERAWELFPALPTGHALGLAYQSQGRLNKAARAWISAWEFDQTNVALMVDIAEVLDVNRKYDEALDWVERALKIDPESEFAFPAACDMRYRADKTDIAPVVALADFLAAHPESDHADHMLWHTSQLCRWTGAIPEQTDEIIELLDHLPPADSPTILTIPIPEPPSALLAFRRTRPHYEIGVADRTEPDPWLPVPGWPGDDAVWNSDGTPAVPPPSNEAVERLRTYGQWRWRHLPGAYEDARRLGELPLSDLLGVLVHPPSPPDATDWASWLRGVQVWACLGIARHQQDEPWLGSTRCRVLLNLAFGTEDWVSEAALFALVATAWAVPEARIPVSLAVARRFQHAVLALNTRPVSIIDSLAWMVLITPEMPRHLVNFACGKEAD
jgi:tetratricopeptide (TPR) repeat protein